VLRGVVWAQAANGVIGRDGTLPWHLPEDMARFRALTAGATVIMGRKTWESLPERFRPLPGRRNVVLTRDLAWRAAGAETSTALTDALRRVGGPHKTAMWDAYVIGGATVYAEALPLVDRAEITEIDQTFDGDVVAPALGADWTEHGPTPQWSTSENGMRYRFRSYQRQVL
jgi:dihydrofolate reductase